MGLVPIGINAYLSQLIMLTDPILAEPKRAWAIIRACGALVASMISVRAPVPSLNMTLTRKLRTDMIGLSWFLN